MYQNLFDFENIKKPEHYVSSTSTYIKPTKEECKTMIFDLIECWTSKKWYQEKKYLLKKIKYWINVYHSYEKNK